MVNAQSRTVKPVRNMRLILLGARMFLAAAGLFLATSLVTPDAGHARRGGEGSVTSCSRYGNGCLTVPVRHGRNGLEYRSPGGNWIECRLDCREALREDKVDFWETLRERSPGGRH